MAPIRTQPERVQALLDQDRLTLALLKAIKLFVEYASEHGMPESGDSPASDGFDQTMRRDGPVHDEFCRRRSQLIDAFGALVEINREPSVRLQAFRFIIEFSDFLQVCACSPVWKKPESRIHVLDDLYTQLTNSFKLWKHIKWTQLPARFHPDGFRFLLPALGQGVVHAFMMYKREYRSPQFDSAPLARFLDRVINHVARNEGIPSLLDTPDQLSPTFIIRQVIEEQAGVLSGVSTVSAPTAPLMVSDGLKWFKPRFPQPGPISDIMTESMNHLGLANKPDQFRGWRGTVWLRQTQRLMLESSLPTVLSQAVSTRLEACYHSFLAESDQDIICTAVENSIPLVKTTIPRAMQPLSQDCYWRIYRSGENIFKGAQDYAGIKVPGGRYTLDASHGSASTLYFATTASCAMAELFDDQPLLCLPDVAGKSLALITWSDAQKASILDLDEVCQACGCATLPVANPLRFLPWSRSARFAGVAHSEQFHGIRYASAKGTTDRNVALFTHGAEPSVPGVFTVERSGRLVNTAEFWAYVAAREADPERKNSVCFTRLPDDISLIPLACEKVPGVYCLLPGDHSEADHAGYGVKPPEKQWPDRA